MHVPVIFAHGEGMFQVLGIALIAGFCGVFCLLGGIICIFSKAEEEKREARYFFIAAAACLLLIFLAPLIVQLFHLS
jgi:heme O synthase-like polyprenyltransferase